MNRRCLFFAFSVMVNMMLLWIFIWGEHGLVDFKALERELTMVVEWNEDLRNKNLALSREIILLESDKKYVEQAARKRLSYIRGNEIWYIFPDGQTPPAGEGVNETED
ncbi:MAG: septum formation initiator family protein [Deltaproteobacteria bacterium]|jgi:cell division protein FtsB|nr:septum formation initiator family protein [Deltaproteobacteria bacterium]